MTGLPPPPADGPREATTDECCCLCICEHQCPKDPTVIGHQGCIACKWCSCRGPHEARAVAVPAETRDDKPNELAASEHVVRDMANGGLRRDDGEVIAALDELLAEYDRRAQYVRILAEQVRSWSEQSRRFQDQVAAVRALADAEIDNRPDCSCAGAPDNGNGVYGSHEGDCASNDLPMVHARAILDALGGVAGSETPAETGGTPETLPRRDDQVAAWIKAARDQQNPDGTPWDLGRWNVLDDLLEDYRLHADTGTPLDRHACEGGYCCADEPQPDPQPVNVDLLARMREGVTSREPAVCAKCGTAGCVEDAESGWYDDETAIVDTHPMRRESPSTDDLVSQMVARIGMGQRLLPWPELTQDLAYIATNLDAALAGNATTTPDQAALARWLYRNYGGNTTQNGDWHQPPWSELNDTIRDAWITEANDAVRAALAGTATTPLPASYQQLYCEVDPDFVAHQDHKYPVEGCGYCPTEDET